MLVPSAEPVNGYITFVRNHDHIVYEVRGVKVKLDFDLAEIYGFSTSAFNQQVKRNAERFDDDFRFQLTREEVERISISQIVTSIQTKGVKE